MTIISRLFRIGKATTNDALDKLERKKPIVMIKQEIQDKREQLVEIDSVLAELKTDFTLTKEKAESAQKDVAKWRESAESGAAQNMPDRDLKLIIYKQINAQKLLSTYSKTLSQLEPKINEIELTSERLEAEIEQAKASQKMLEAKISTNKVLKKSSSINSASLGRGGEGGDLSDYIHRAEIQADEENKILVERTEKVNGIDDGAIQAEFEKLKAKQS